MKLASVLRERLGALEERHRELQVQAADPERAGRPDYPALLREMGSLDKVLGPWTRYQEL